VKITLKQMSVFDAVATLGSISRAARQLSLTPSAVSMALAEMESQLGLKLFDHRPGALTLNEDGRRFQPKVRSALLAARDVERLSNIVPREGTIRIGASTTIGNHLLPSICARFVSRHPAVQLSLSVMPTVNVTRQVENFTLDIGFIDTTSLLNNLRITPWIDDPLAVVCGSRHRLARQPSVTAEELSTETWYLQQQRSITRAMLGQVLLSRVDSIRIGLETDSIESIKRALCEGYGVACLSRRYVEDDVRQGRLCVLKTDGFSLTRTLAIVARKDVQPNSVTEEFISLALETYPQETRARSLQTLNVTESARPTRSSRSAASADPVA